MNKRSLKRQPGVPIPRGQRGAAMMEYVLITLLIVIVLIASPNVIEEIVNALKEVYRAFVYALGMSYPTPGPGT
jgi:Flp pilus assembly pilin Flp